MSWVREMTSVLSKTIASSSSLKFSTPPLPRETVMTLLARSLAQMRALPTLVDIALPAAKEGDRRGADDLGHGRGKPGTLTICGDTHGQYFDLLHIFSPPVAAWPSPSNAFLFNGDFVDRGVYSFEVIITLLAIKLAEPQSMHLLRGNHETTDMNAAYGFEKQILDKYDWEVLRAFRAVFSALPVCAVVEDRVFVVHGGLGPESASLGLDELRGMERDWGGGGGGRDMGDGMDEVLPEPVAEMLWCDPLVLREGVPLQKQLGFRANQQRGGGWVFGPDVTASFLAKNRLRMLVRSHEARQAGFTIDHEVAYPLSGPSAGAGAAAGAAAGAGGGGQSGQEPSSLSPDDYLRCLTVFSAPNYCDAQGNLGAFVRISRGEGEGEGGEGEGEGRGSNVAVAWAGLLEPAGPGKEGPLQYKVFQFSATPHPRSSPTALKVIARQHEAWARRDRVAWDGRRGLGGQGRGASLAKAKGCQEPSSYSE